MDLLQDHFSRLEEGYGKDCGKYMAQPLDLKVETFSSKRVG